MTLFNIACSISAVPRSSGAVKKTIHASYKILPRFPPELFGNNCQKGGDFSAHTATNIFAKIRDYLLFYKLS
jgi:hypothetical protein